MLSGLLASARELRNPLTVGFSALLAFWLVAGEAVNEAALADPLGRRLVLALESMGDPVELALYTFAAAMVGSLLWNGAVQRMVRSLSVLAGHPDWDGMIEEAREAVRRYEEYEVTTTARAVAGGISPATDKQHQVPSPRHAAYLHERVEERERKAAEMSFRVTLAVALVPVAIGLGLEGGGLWWWWLAAIPVIWFDVALLKYTTLRTVRRYRMEDLQSRISRAEHKLESERKRAATSIAAAPRADPSLIRRKEDSLARQKKEIDSLKAAAELLRVEESGLLTKLFAFFEGQPGR